MADKDLEPNASNVTPSASRASSPADGDHGGATHNVFDGLDPIIAEGERIMPWLGAMADWSLNSTALDLGRPETAEEEDDRNEREREAWGTLMEMPAPHSAALLWKLDQLLGNVGDAGCENWSAEFLAQTVADYRRLLSPACSA